MILTAIIAYENGIKYMKVLDFLGRHTLITANTNFFLINFVKIFSEYNT